MNGKISQPIEPYLGERELDRLMRINTSLLTEIWQLRDRMAIMEQLLEDKAMLAAGEIEEFQPSPEMNVTLEELRSQMIDRVIGSADDSGYTVQSLIEKVSKQESS